MIPFKKLAIAGAIAAFGVMANASTLVFNFSGTVNDLQIPAQYADLYDVWNSDPNFKNYYGTVIVDNFQDYASGTHTLNIAASDSPINLSLVNGLLTGLEGARVRGTGAFQPDNSQVGDAGALTIVDGAVTGFTWSAASWDSAALKTFNDRLFIGGGFPVVIRSVDVNVGASVPLVQVGDTYFGQNVRGTATVIMGAVPEPGTYALMAAGLAAVGFIARRRRAVS